MATRPIVGFIGTGMMGQLAHLGNYARLRDSGECEIAGVTDLRTRLAESVAERYGIPKAYGSMDELLGDASVDAVVCVLQWPSNYAVVKQVLQAGKALITEKPMVGRLDEAEELVALAEERGLVYAVGFMKRYDTGVEIAKKLVDGLRESGELGALLTVDAVCDSGDWLHSVEPPLQVDDPMPPPIMPTYPDACRTGEQRTAYGYLLNIFSHNINLCHHLLGAEIEPRSAQFRSDNAMNVTARCGDTLVTVRGAVARAHEWREWTTLTFERGEVRVKTPTPMNRQMSARVALLHEGANGYETVNYHASVDWAFLRQARGFVRTLAGEEQPRASAKTCLWDVRAMQRIIEIAEVI